MAAALAEKKIAILQRGLEFHPGSDQLLLALLNEVCCYMFVCTVPCSLSADFRQGQLHAAQGSALVGSFWLMKPRGQLQSAAFSFCQTSEDLEIH